MTIIEKIKSVKNNIYKIFYNIKKSTYRNIPSEPIVEIPSEPIVEIPSEPIVEIPSEPIVEIPSEPIVEIPSEPIVEIPSEPIVEIPSEPIVEIPSEPIVEIPSEPIVEIPSEPIVDVSKILENTSTPKLVRLDSYEIEELPPGILLDTNVLIHFDDYPLLLKYGQKFTNKFGSKPIYLLSKSKNEFLNKFKPQNEKELIRDLKNTGVSRNFENLIEKLPSSLNTNVYLVIINNSEKLTKKSQQLMSELHELGLHNADSSFLAFAKLTNSYLITCDKILIRCCKLAQCKFIEFLELTEKLFQPSPITIIHKKRRLHHKKNPESKKRYFHTKNKRRLK